MKRICRACFGIVFFSIVIAGASVCASAQENDRGFDCGDKGNHWDNYRGAYHCEVREQTLPAPAGRLSLDGQRNGGVSVRGWDRREMLVRARIQAWGKSDADVRAVASQIRIETGGAFVRAVAPAGEDGRGISVSYEIFLPRESDLALKTYNGGTTAGRRGRIELTRKRRRHLDDSLATCAGGRTNGGRRSRSTATAGRRRLEARHNAASRSSAENYSARLEDGDDVGRLKVISRTCRENGKDCRLSGFGGATVRR